MSKLLLAIDDYLHLCDGCYYADNQSLFDMFQRYLRVFDKLLLVARCTTEQSKDARWVCLGENIEVCAIPFFSGWLQYAKQYFKIGKIIKICDGYDAAIIRLPGGLPNRVARQIKKQGMPYAVEVVYAAFDAVRTSRGVDKFLWWIIDREMRKFCSQANGVSCVTKYYLQQRYFSTRIGNFESHYSTLNLDKGFYYRQRKYTKKEQYTVLHVANQIEYHGRKGHNELIEVIAGCKERNVNIRVRFIGGDYHGGIGRLTKMATRLGVSDRIEFVGQLSRSELKREYEVADLYVLPTKAEGLPRSIIEAMASGLPCVSTNVSGNIELLQERFLLNCGDIEGFTNQIAALVSDGSLYEDTSAYNFRHSLEYEASILQRRRDEFYQKLRALI